VEDADPLRLTLRCSGTKTADLLRENGVECEYADPESLVLMLTPENEERELEQLKAVLGRCETIPERVALPLAKGERICSIRQALFAPHEAIPAEESLGRICGAPTVACPPAIPIAVSGERIGVEALELFRHYGVKMVDVLK